MLNKLFRPKWQHENPEVRKAAVEKLSANELDILKQIASSDIAEDVRELAMSKIQDADTLLALARSASSPQQKQEFLRQWARFIADPSQTAAFDAEQLLIECLDTELLNAIITYSSNDNLSELALAGLTDEQSLLTLIKTGSHKVRQAAVAKLETEESLKKALALVKGRDKKSAQTIKAKLEAFKQAESIRQTELEALNKLQNKLDYLLSHESVNHFEGEVMAVQQAWLQIQQASTDIDAKTTETVQLQVDQLTHKVASLKELEAHNAEFAKQQAIKREEAHQLTTQIQIHIQSLSTWQHGGETTTESLQEQQTSFQQAFDTHEDAVDKGEYKQMKALLNQAAQLLNAINRINRYLQDTATTDQPSTPAPAESNDFKVMRRELKQLSQLLDGLKGESQALLPDAAKPLQLRQQYLQEQLQQTRHQEQDNGKQVQQWLDDAEAAIDAKKPDDARRLLAKSRNQIQKLPSQAAHRFQPTLSRLSAAVNELDDWKRFSTEPKRQELCQAMEKLADIELPAQQKAKEIHELQDQWKQLGFCQNKSLWEHFKQLGEKAYSPCRDAFHEQKEVRQFNAKQRQEICEQLEAYLNQHDWQSTDWHALDKLYQKVVEEWKRFSPVERDEHERLQARFSECAGVIRDKLQGYKKANLSTLEQLAETAETLAQSIDDTGGVDGAIEQYQTLLEQWKSVGLVYHKPRQKIWQRFKDAGDSLYQQRSEQRQSADAERQQSLTQANSLIEQLQVVSTNLASESDTEKAAELRQTARQLQTDFNALDELPHKARAAVQKSFERQWSQYQQAGKQQKHSAWLHQFDRLITICSEDESEADNDLPSHWLSNLQQRANAEEKPSAEQIKNQCLELEILLDAETPEADTASRMEIQMKKLAGGLGQKTQQDVRTQLDNAINQWAATPACEDVNLYIQYAKRFQSAVHSWTSNQT
ncbi:putative protein/MSMEI_2664 [BD1-7 clade bacterium]|uniref:DUF349 domain-containing protein n=1 Tax=BD1-7 clade bacterium TaxID=2029982 RepID=A0A5S9N3C3_9GAMM|nr:putative protein/MSMEI_2664 [BD1-7 clade bacterium]